MGSLARYVLRKQKGNDVVEKTCKNCFHYQACREMLRVQGYVLPENHTGNAERCDTFVAATDVVPRSDYELERDKVSKLEVGLLRASTRCIELGATLELMKGAAESYKRRYEKTLREGTWVVTENGCVITCSECGYRLELCYPDGTEVRWLPGCPNCRTKMNGGAE